MFSNNDNSRDSMISWEIQSFENDKWLAQLNIWYQDWLRIALKWVISRRRNPNLKASERFVIDLKVLIICVDFDEKSPNLDRVYAVIKQLRLDEWMQRPPVCHNWLMTCIHWHWRLEREEESRNKKRNNWVAHHFCIKYEHNSNTTPFLNELINVINPYWEVE